MKKIIVVSAVAVAMFGTAGVAYAGDDDQSGGHRDSHSSHDRDGHSRDGHGFRSGQGQGGTNCTSNDTVNQSNRGHQFVGGNLAAQDAKGNVLGLQSSRPAGICPSIGNNNHF